MELDAVVALLPWILVGALWVDARFGGVPRVTGRVELPPMREQSDVRRSSASGWR